MSTQATIQTASDPAVACTGLLAKHRTTILAALWFTRQWSEEIERGWGDATPRRLKAASNLATRCDKARYAIMDQFANAPAQRPPAKDV
jgi:hypothetical protein